MPVKLSLYLGRVNGITPIMPRAVLDKMHKSTELLFGFSGQFGQYPANHIDQVQVLTAMPTANIIHFTHPAATEYSVEGYTVIFNIQPVTHIRAIAIDWNGLFPQTGLDNSRNKLLIVLVGTIIIRTVRRDSWESIGLVVGPY
jgi:hypothetical protein